MSETTVNNDKITDGNGNNVSHIPNVSGKWVSVKERLPYKNGNSDIWCLVYGDNRISLHPYNEHHKCWDDEEGDDYWTDATDGKVTHWMSLPEKPMTEIKPANTVKVIQIETTCLEDGLILERCEYQDGVRIGSGACSMCENYMKESKRFYNPDKYLTCCSKYTEEQAKAQNLKYSIV